MNPKIKAIKEAVDAIRWGVQYHIDAFYSAAAKQGGRARRVNHIADATRPSRVPPNHVLAEAEGPGWSCRLVQVGSSAEVRS